MDLCTTLSPLGKGSDTSQSWKGISLFISVSAWIHSHLVLILKSLHLADLRLPPVIQCSVLDVVQELVHIIPQHALSTFASSARLLLPWGQRSNRELSLIFQNGRMMLPRYDTSVSLTLQVSFAWFFEQKQVLRCSWATKRRSVLFNFFLLHIIYLDTVSERSCTCKYTLNISTAKLLKLTHQNDKLSRLKRRWVTILNFSFLSVQFTVITCLLYHHLLCLSSSSCQATLNGCNFTFVHCFVSPPWAPTRVQDESDSIILLEAAVIGRLYAQHSNKKIMFKDKIATWK